MKRIVRVLGPLAALAGVAMAGGALAGCSSTKSGGATDAARGGAAGIVSGTGGVATGGTTVASGGTMSGSGGLGSGGVLSGGAGGAGTSGAGTGGAGTGGAGGTGVPDAGPDVSMSLDASNGGAGSGGRTTGAGGTSAGGGTGTGGGGGAPRTGGTSAGGSGGGGSGAGGATATGGVAGSGGTAGGGCSRALDQDSVCRGRVSTPRAYQCPASAPPPSATCLRLTTIGSNDIYCCSDGFVACPDNLPADGAACPGPVACRYGSHPNLACRTRATCASGSWQLSTPPSSCTDPLPAAGCPASPTDGADCSTDKLECYYATGDYCICAQCTREYPACILSDPVAWHCLTPPGGNCPAMYPNLGTACALPTTAQCRYRCDLIAACSADGVWMAAAENCPICNAPDTPIATPNGNRPIASLAPGDLVYSVHRGRMSIVPIESVGRHAVRDHHVMQLVLDTGTVLEISPGHPTADGRRMGDLTTDDRLDGVRIVSATLVAFRHSHTYDILPASDTGTYYAGGVLIGSTLAPAQRLVAAPIPTCVSAAPSR